MCEYHATYTNSKSNHTLYCVYSEGDSAKFVCKISGQPRPEVTWLFNGKPLKESNKFKVIEEEETYTLKISKTKKDMSGKYTVRAKNKRGVKESSADLVVTLLGKYSSDVS